MKVKDVIEVVPNGCAGRPGADEREPCQACHEKPAHHRGDATRPTRDQQRHRGDHEQRHREDGAAARAQPVRQPAHAGRGVVGEVGDDVEQVGSHPEQRRAPDDLGRRRRAAHEVDEDGQRAERHGIRQPRERGRLQAQVVAPRRDDHDEVDRPRHRPAGEREDHGGREGEGAGGSHDGRWQLTGRERLVGATDGGVTSPVPEVVGPPDRELAGEHGGGDEGDARRVEVGGDREEQAEHGDRERGRRVGRPQQGRGAGRHGLTLGSDSLG